MTLERTHFKTLKVFTFGRTKSIKKLRFSVQKILWKLLNWIVIYLRVSWAHIWVVFCQWYCFFSLFFFYISATFYILCLFYCLVSVTLVKITDQNFYYKARINIRAIQIIFCQYFYGNYTPNVSFNLYLFKRAIFDVI